MKGIVFDTTVKEGYVAAFDGERERVCFLDPTLSTQSALIPASKRVLSDLGLSSKDLDGVAAVVGPGSFTGIRIGVTFANAMAFALSLPRFSLTAFDVMSALVPGAPAYAVSAGHNGYYAAIRERDELIQKNVDDGVLPLNTVLQDELTSELPIGALLIAQKAFEEREFSACAPTLETTYLKPLYMKKSQAERLKEQRK